MQILIFSMLAVAAYFLGCIASSVIIAKYFGCIDPRTSGSKNPGATNMLRVNNKYVALMTLIADLLKGMLPVLFAKMLGLDSLEILVIGMFAFVGHIYPVFYAFHGGKGVATALGVLIGYSLQMALILVLIWLIIYFFSKIVSLASITTFIIFPFATLLFFNWPEAIVALLMALISIVAHKANIRQLMVGTEQKTEIFNE
jgi:glycerol-3-phosphate acyltransferase PlsY